uniref:Protein DETOXIFICATION n=1 Tax=Aegilops tauschii subsp. strangulata TaxID=200361 RepID=A0A452ZNC2_AEGTS
HCHADREVNLLTISICWLPFGAWQPIALTSVAHSYPIFPAKQTMEEQLLATGTGKKGDDESPVLSEVKKQLRLAGPLVVGCLLQNVVQMISVMFVGHLGELALSAASMATSFANVTGFSLLVPTHTHPFLLHARSTLTRMNSNRRPAWRAAWTRCAGRRTAPASTACWACTSSGRCWCCRSRACRWRRSGRTRAGSCSCSGRTRRSRRAPAATSAG